MKLFVVVSKASIPIDIRKKAAALSKSVDEQEFTFHFEPAKGNLKTLIEMFVITKIDYQLLNK
jgi:hypothetical protein